MVEHAAHEPACHCPQPSRWDERRDDGVWDLRDTDDDPLLHQRTCMACGASLCREVDAHAARVLAMQAEIAECEARGDAVGRLMADNVRRDLATIVARREVSHAVAA